MRQVNKNDKFKGFCKKCGAGVKLIRSLAASTTPPIPLKGCSGSAKGFYACCLCTETRVTLGVCKRGPLWHSFAAIKRQKKRWCCNTHRPTARVAILKCPRFPSIMQTPQENYLSREQVEPSFHLRQHTTLPTPDFVTLSSCLVDLP